MSETYIEGEMMSLVETILDEYDQPVIPFDDSQGPLVTLMDGQDIVSQVTANVDQTEAGAWRADIPVPEMGLVEPTTLKVLWVLTSDEDIRYKVTSKVTINPQAEGRDTNIVFVQGRDSFITVTSHIKFRETIKGRKGDVINNIPATPDIEGDLLTFSIYYDNEPLMDRLDCYDSSIKMKVYSDRIVANIPDVLGRVNFQPVTLMVDHTRRGAMTPTTLTYTLWPVTPQILLAANHLEEHINKARVANIIPELDYTITDLLQYLYRGLSLFNSYGPQITSFNGTNMKGHILNHWLLCSSYYALAAQLQAEGALAFDFAGQSTSLNVDRSPAIESALGRVESQMQDILPKYKKLLARYGVTTGSGSQGDKPMDGSSNLGAVSLTNSPVTRIPRIGRMGNGWSFWRS